MLAATLTFLTPIGGLLALSVLLPATAAVVVAARNRRGRQLLGLAAPGPDHRLALFLGVPLLIGLAAAQPVLRTQAGRRIRTDAQAIFIFDTSRSMAASAGPAHPTRLQQAQAAAIQLRANAIADVPSGVASLTTQLLPHLFPVADLPTFNSTVEQAIGVERPPPPAVELGTLGTSFQPLDQLRDQGFFTPSTRRRVAILLTDGESGPYDPQEVGQALVGPGPPDSLNGTARSTEATVPLIVIRVGSAHDRIYQPNGRIEVEYQPLPRAAATVATLAAQTRGRVFTQSDLGAAGSMLRRLIGPGRGVARGARTKSTALARWIVLSAAALLAYAIWHRNVRAL